MATIKLAEALLRRKELQQKVDQLRPINKENLFELKVNRQNVTESIDNIAAQVPKISLTQVTSAYDYYAKNLRLLDAQIQRTNWETPVDVSEHAMEDWVDPYVADPVKK